MHPIRCALLVPLILIAGCDELESNESTVEQTGDPEVQMAVLIDTRADDDGDLRTVVSVALADRSGDEVVPILLAEGDTLVARVGGQSVPLERLPDTQEGESAVYEAAFQPDISGEAVEVFLDRNTIPASGNWFPVNDSPEPDFEGLLVNATSSIELMEDFSINSPDDDEEFLVDDATQVTITWTPADVADNRRLLYATSCGSGLSTGEVDVDGDAGMVTVDLNTFLEDQPDPEAGECEIQLLVIGEVSGSVDPVLSDASVIRASHRRSVSIRSVPPDA